MSSSSIGVAVIGAGMVGRAHANGYRAASTVFGTEHPEVRLVAVADLNEEFAQDTATRFGYERTEKSWEALVDAPDVDAVSVAVANHLHREIVEAMLAAGKHVLCEKPLAPTSEDAQAMVDAAEGTDQVAAVGFTFRRSPAINAIREQVGDDRHLGAVRHFNGHYWCDYGASPDAPISWRYRGGPGSGALADIGSHMVDLGEFLCGPIVSVQGAALPTLVSERPVPVGAAVGHAATEVSDEREPVENEDIATFTATFASGAVGTFSVSRVHFGHANALGFEVFCEHGAAGYDLERAAEFTIADATPAAEINGYRQVLVGPAHPYIARGLPMDFPSVGHGQNDFFVYQARAFLNAIAGRTDELPAPPTMSEGLHNMRVLDAVKGSAAAGGEAVTVE